MRPCQVVAVVEPVISGVSLFSLVLSVLSASLSLLADPEVVLVVAFLLGEVRAGCPGPSVDVTGACLPNLSWIRKTILHSLRQGDPPKTALSGISANCL